MMTFSRFEGFVSFLLFCIVNILNVNAFSTIHSYHHRYLPKNKNSSPSQTISSNFRSNADVSFNRLDPLHSVGDIFSGITGQAPDSLEPPLAELLVGTNIDPAKGNVDLQCVYKASRCVKLSVH